MSDANEFSSIAPGVTAPPDAIRVQFSRAGGPGGQNVNKLNTKAELWLAVDRLIGLTPSAVERLATLAGRRLTVNRELHLICETERSASANQKEIFARLRDLIIEAKVEPRRRRKTRPTRASKMRRLETKKRRSDVKSNRRRGSHD